MAPLPGSPLHAEPAAGQIHLLATVPDPQLPPPDLHCTSIWPASSPVPTPSGMQPSLLFSVPHGCLAAYGGNACGGLLRGVVIADARLLCAVAIAYGGNAFWREPQSMPSSTWATANLTLLHVLFRTENATGESSIVPGEDLGRQWRMILQPGLLTVFRLNKYLDLHENEWDNSTQKLERNRSDGYSLTRQVC
ncbi:hypothetical protein TRIUR3_03603 [Triticum urartu]|uniref:Uncharacterized protein n=1 Tax=Triticum urartu TaxID=4572 RepID=M7ZXZ2_TRIUA|nr:hypothetical protein TRIUR3_03603 [Triticum urartu]